MAPADARGRIEENLGRCRQAIAAAAERVERDPAGVGLVAVTKSVGSDIIRLLHAAGLRDFGESTVQRGLSMSAALGDLEGVRWHLLGHLQRNKVRRALGIFTSIHSVDSLRLLAEIAAHGAAAGKARELYVEVNIAAEPRKTGLPVLELRDLLRAAREEQLLGLPGAERSPPSLACAITGLMTMAPQDPDPEQSRPCFRALRELRDACINEGLLPPGAALSMGMSGDFQVAVEEGATHLRIGSLLFEGLSPCPA